jgi:hypothetical protein
MLAPPTCQTEVADRGQHGGTEHGSALMPIASHLGTTITLKASSTKTLKQLIPVTPFPCNPFRLGVSARSEGTYQLRRGTYRPAFDGLALDTLDRQVHAPGV